MILLNTHTITITRETAGFFSAGKKTSTKSTISATCSLQPVNSDEETLFYADFAQTLDRRVAISSTELKINDLFTYSDKKYRIFRLKAFPEIPLAVKNYEGYAIEVQEN